MARRFRRVPSTATKIASGTVGVLLMTSATFALEGWTSPTRIAALSAVAALMVSLVWAFLAGWRLRNPLHRLPAPKERTPAEEESRESLRRLRSDLTAFCHARFTPAINALKEMTTHVVGELEQHSAGAALAGRLLDAYPVVSVDSSMSKLMDMLTGGDLWADSSPRVREIILDMDLDRRKPDDLVFLTFIAFAYYRNLLRWTIHAAGVCGKQIADLPRYEDWKRRDDSLVDRLRELFANPAFESYRTDLEELFW